MRSVVPNNQSHTRWADEDAPHTQQALSLVWRRFSPPRFKLSAVADGQAGGGFKPQDIRQVYSGALETYYSMHAFLPAPPAPAGSTHVLLYQ